MGDFMEQVYMNLTDFIKSNNNFLIMTHKNPDFDGMGSSIALQQIIKNFGKECSIVINSIEMDKSLKKALKKLDDKGIIIDTVNKSNVESCITEETTLIILDTYKQYITECPFLVDKIKNIVLIDHHIKGKDYIKANFEYINANLSSVVEFITYYIKYLNQPLDSFIATYLLVGLEIDTNYFKLKTTDKTYEAAAFLTRMGADSILKQELHQESMDSYIKRSRLIEKSFMINSNMAMCVTDSKVYKKKDLAKLAENLLEFENVEASFVIGKISSKIVGISARSIGNLNVEEIMSKLGGGGHLNEAAAQFENVSISEVKRKLESVIK